MCWGSFAAGLAAGLLLAIVAAALAIGVGIALALWWLFDPTEGIEL